MNRLFDSGAPMQGTPFLIPFSEREHAMGKKKKAAKGKKRAKGFWSKSDINLLKRLFPTTATAKISKKLGRKTDAVKKKASRMGLSKSKSYLKSLGRG